MESESDILQQHASILLKEFCALHKKNKQNNVFTSYAFLCKNGIFHDTAISKLLLSIKDESYSYLDTLDDIPEQSVLLNLFSGSGRLMRELIEKNILRKFRIVYNLDSSAQMLEFEKRHFDMENMKFICTDILHVKPNDFSYDIAIFHCGLRYINTNSYTKLVDVLLKLKRSNKSRCIVTEIDERFIEELSTVLQQVGIKFKWERRKVTVQRNTALYLSHIYYETNQKFQTTIDEIARKEKKLVQDILKETSGYKNTNMNILFF